MTKKLFLIDGNSYLYRNHHGRPESYTKTGIQNHAFNGTWAMIQKDLNRFDFDYYGIVFDTGIETYRRSMYPEYKAHRPPMSDDLEEQWSNLMAHLTMNGYPVIRVDGFEGDDVIATIAKRITSNQALDFEVTISTKDKDIAQIVNEKIKLVDTMGEDSYTTHENVKEKFGVPAESIVDLLTLKGDKADNIKFLENCGQKTAVRLIETFGNVENIIQNPDKILDLDPKIRGGKKLIENIKANTDNLLLAKKLITLADLDMKLGLSMFQKRETHNPDENFYLEKFEYLDWKKDMRENIEQNQRTRKRSP